MEGKKKHHTICCVPQCPSRGRGPSYHCFPKDPRQRTRWAAALKVGKNITSGLVVCGNHFKDSDFFPKLDLPGSRTRLKKGVIPTLHIPDISLENATPSPEERSSSHEREWRSPKRMRVVKSPTEITETSSEDEQLEDEEEACAAGIPENDEDDDNEDDNVYEEIACIPLLLEDKEVQVTESQISSKRSTSRDDCVPLFLEDKEVQVTQGQLLTKNWTVSELLDSPSKVNCFTGISSMELLEKIIQLVHQKENIPRTGKPFALTTKDRVVLTLVKLKLNLSYLCLAVLFRTSNNTAQRVFFQTISILKEALKNVVSFTPKEVVDINRPSSFSDFPNVRTVLYCTEMPVDKTQCLTCKSRTCSHLDGSHTIKVMFGVTPTGVISFCSPAKGGGYTEEQIFMDSGLLDLLKPGDEVIVDKSFLITGEFLARGIKFIRPPLVDAIATSRIAAVRMQVERSVQRIKVMKILNSKLPYHILPIIDDIIIVVSALVNLSSPISSDDKF